MARHNDENFQIRVESVLKEAFFTLAKARGLTPSSFLRNLMADAVGQSKLEVGALRKDVDRCVASIKDLQRTLFEALVYLAEEARGQPGGWERLWENHRMLTHFATDLANEVPARDIDQETRQRLTEREVVRFLGPESASEPEPTKAT